MILKVNFIYFFSRIKFPSDVRRSPHPRFLQLDSAAHGFISSCDMQAQPAILSFQIKMD